MFNESLYSEAIMCAGHQFHKKDIGKIDATINQWILYRVFTLQ